MEIRYSVSVILKLCVNSWKFSTGQVHFQAQFAYLELWLAVTPIKITHKTVTLTPIIFCENENSSQTYLLPVKMSIGKYARFLLSIVNLLFVEEMDLYKIHPIVLYSTQYILQVIPLLNTETLFHPFPNFRSPSVVLAVSGISISKRKVKCLSPQSGHILCGKMYPPPLLQAKEVKQLSLQRSSYFAVTLSKKGY